MRAFYEKSLEEIITILQNQKQEIKQKYAVNIIGVFGSYSRNEATSFSDIDIYVELERPIGLKFYTLWNELEEKLSCKVDLITKEAALQKPSLYSNIMKDLKYV